MTRPKNFDYQRYLASREWAVLKAAVRARAVRDLGDEWCERCALLSRIAAVHHLTYARIGHEQMEDLQGVCRRCHDWLSGVSDYDPVAETLRWFARDGFASVAYQVMVEAWESTIPRPVSFWDWNTDHLQAEIERRWDALEARA